MKLSFPLLFSLLPILSAAPTLDKAKTFGNPDAPITIELFSDFQCPSCRMLHITLLPSIMRDYVLPGKAYLVYKEYPLPQHNHSREAAAYACAAARVGKYEQVADALFQNQPAWAENGKVFETVSTALTPAEQKKVQALARDPGILDEVQQDVQQGQSQGVNQTPTMLIIHGTKRYPVAGVPNYSLLRSILDGLAK
ncbi:MAG: thioredoxin domain-containing protein [Acidobacteriia bacterium]|nr:thioredoxin domain-containing protein [Terriglobia bacterium]